jgi:activating signal cointegrator complex subunit 3
MLDNQLWDFSHPLRQHKFLSQEIIEKIEKAKISMDTLRETSADEIGAWIKHPKMGAVVKRCAEEFPLLDLNVCIQPITRNVLRVKIDIMPNFRYLM